MCAVTLMHIYFEGRGNNGGADEVAEGGSGNGVPLSVESQENF